MSNLDVQQYVNGVWAKPEDKLKSHPRPSPRATTEVSFPQLSSSPEQVEEAVSAAKAGFERFRSRSPVEKSHLLRNMASRLAGARSEIAELIVNEVGKTLGEAQGEIDNACELLSFFAGSPLRRSGEVLDSRLPNSQIITRRSPLGVVAAITPWNFPVNLTVLKLAPAIAAGNSVVVKPAPEAAAVVTALIGALVGEEDDAPISLVHGDAEAGERLINSPGVDCIGFTGSSAVGHRVSVLAANRGVPCLCEMGGHNPLIVMDSASIPDAAESIIVGAYRMAGQKCTATSRVLVHHSVHDLLMSKLVRRLRDLVVGDPMDQGTFMGPVISDESRSRVVGAADDAIEKGAALIWPEDLNIDSALDGYYVPPILLDGLHSNMVLAREEVFGPILAIRSVADLDEAIAVGNDSDYGLTASVYTRDVGDAMSCIDRLEAGTVLVNQPTAGLEFHAPFGGWKSSSVGAKEQGDEAVGHYTESKTSYLSW